jgi:hypothetical protein
MYKYSPMEGSLLAIFRANRAGRRFTTVELIAALYKKRSAPMNARQSVVSVMKILTAKVDGNREPFRIQRSERRAPSPLEFWREPR